MPEHMGPVKQNRRNQEHLDRLREEGRLSSNWRHVDDDPRDVTDQLGLQDARDDEDREVIYDDVTDPVTGEPPSWREKWDTYEEWKGER